MRPAGLALGDQGSEVRAVHDFLHRFGYFTNPELAEHYPGWQPAASRDPADPEVFDAALEEGVRLYQKAMGLPETGVVDAETRNHMQTPRRGLPDNYTPTAPDPARAAVLRPGGEQVEQDRAHVPLLQLHVAHEPGGHP